MLTKYDASQEKHLNCSQALLDEIYFFPILVPGTARLTSVPYTPIIINIYFSTWTHFLVTMVGQSYPCHEAISTYRCCPGV